MLAERLSRSQKRQMHCVWRLINIQAVSIGELASCRMPLPVYYTMIADVTMHILCRKQVEEQQRQQLLSGSRSATDYAMQRDADSQGMSYVDNSKRVLEEAFQTGTAVLQNMSGQRERLKV